MSQCSVQFVGELILRETRISEAGNVNSQILREELQLLNNELETFGNEKLTGSFICSKAQWIEDG